MNSSQSRKRYFGRLRLSVIYIYLSEYLETRKNNIYFLFLCSYFQFEALQPLHTVSNHPHHLGPVSLSKFISWTSIVLHFVIFTNKLRRLEKCGCFAPRCFFSFLFFFTIGGSVRVEQVSQQAFLDGGIPTQGLLVQDEQEAVELHQELVQHCKTAQSKCCQLWENCFNPEWLLWDFTLWLVILKHWLLMKGVSRLLLEGERRAIRSLWSFQTEKIKPRHSLVFQCQIRSVRQPLTQDRV